MSLDSKEKLESASMLEPREVMERWRPKGPQEPTHSQHNAKFPEGSKGQEEEEQGAASCLCRGLPGGENSASQVGSLQLFQR